jgi:hypothetical protein
MTSGFAEERATTSDDFDAVLTALDAPGADQKHLSVVLEAQKRWRAVRSAASDPAAVAFATIDVVTGAMACGPTSTASFEAFRVAHGHAPTLTFAASTVASDASTHDDDAMSRALLQYRRVQDLLEQSCPNQYVRIDPDSGLYAVARYRSLVGAKFSYLHGHRVAFTMHIGTT